MLYAQVKDKAMWPMTWEKCQNMANHLNRITWGYQLTIEARMFYSEIHPEYRGTLIKWENNRVTRDMKREILLETSDISQMESALFMLINEAEPEYKAAKMQWVQYER